MASYHVHVDGQSTGPFTEEQLREQLAAGTINEETLVWPEGAPDWVPLKEIKLDKPKIKLRQAEPASSVQFERAEFSQPAAAAVKCSNCKAPIPDEYYVVNGEIACRRCQDGLQSALTGGSGAGRFLRASAAGLAAAAVSAGIWYAVLKLLNMELGLLAIGVGLLVGFAVRWGSQGRGGWKYQLLAVALTYSAIVSSYIPLLIEGFREESKHQEQATAPTDAAAVAGLDTPPESVAAEVPAKRERTFATMMIAYSLLFVLALATPFLMGFSNIIGLLIIAIALWEAWKINKRVPLAIEGPFRVGVPRASA